MTVIKSTLKPRAKDFKENATAQEAVVADLREKTLKIALGGPLTSREAWYRGRNASLLPTMLP